MFLAKARDLMRLAEMAAARHQGVSLAEVAEAFDAATAPPSGWPARRRTPSQR
jgi:hypothetical protein